MKRIVLLLVLLVVLAAGCQTYDPIWDEPNPYPVGSADYNLFERQRRLDAQMRDTRSEQAFQRWKSTINTGR